MLLGETIEGLLVHIPGIRDGRSDSIHQARVATRRMRELLPLVPTLEAGSAGALGELVRSLGRSLGKVRELDSLIQLTEEMSRRYPASAPLLAACRVDLGRRRQRSARRLITTLEDLDVAPLRDMLPRGSRFSLLHRNASEWEPRLSNRLERRAKRLERAIDRAGGVYFPNRLHKVRIALKKLRYLAEIAEGAQVWQPAHLVRDAKRLQDALGTMHDMQVLQHFVADLADEWRPQVRTFKALSSADIDERHRAYLARRHRLHAMIAASRRFARGSGHASARRTTAGLATALLLPAGVLWLSRPGGRSLIAKSSQHAFECDSPPAITERPIAIEVVDSTVQPASAAFAEPVEDLP
jgi:CHAD domain-containing protein